MRHLANNLQWLSPDPPLAVLTAADREELAAAAVGWANVLESTDPERSVRLRKLAQRLARN